MIYTNLRNLNKNLPSQSLNIISDVNTFHNMPVQELSGGDVSKAYATNPAQRILGSVKTGNNVS